MIGRKKVKKIMDTRGLQVCDAILILIASSEDDGQSWINKDLTKQQLWNIMDKAVDEIKSKEGGSFNMKDGIYARIIATKILREFGKIK